VLPPSLIITNVGCQKHYIQKQKNTKITKKNQTFLPPTSEWNTSDPHHIHYGTCKFCTPNFLDPIRNFAAGPSKPGRMPQHTYKFHTSGVKASTL